MTRQGLAMPVENVGRASVLEVVAGRTPVLA
jgi:hypothetical protein